MKVTKVDIRTTKLDIQNSSVYSEYKLNGIKLANLQEARLYSDLNVERKDYNIFQYYNPHTDDTKRYAVRSGYKEIFDDLLDITEASIDKRIRKAYNQGLKEGYLKGANQGKEDTLKRIRDLSLWERIFKKF